MTDVKKVLLGCTMLIAPSFSSCLDDLDVDKISSDIDMNMSVVVPMANGDITVWDFANPEKYNAVEYFDESFGKDLLKFKDGNNEIYKRTIFSLLGMEGEVTYDSQALDFDALLRLGATPFDGEKEVTKTTDLKFRVSNQYNVDIKSLLTSLDVEIESTACTAQCEYELTFPGDKKVTFLVPGDSQNKSLSDVTLTCVDEYITIPLTIKATVNNSSRIGNLKFKIVLTDLTSIIASANSTLYVPVPADIMSTGMHSLKRFQGTVKLNDPKINLYTTNTSALDILVKPGIKTWDNNKTEDLYVEPFIISAKANKEEHNYDKKNCDIQRLFEFFPNDISVGADLEMSMPNEADEVTVYKNDEVIIGYQFDIPANMAFKGTVDEENMSFSNVSDDMENVERARIITKTMCSFPFYPQVKVSFVNKDTGKVFGDPLYIDIVDRPTIDEYGLYAGKEESKTITTDLTTAQVKQLRETKELIFSIAINEDQDNAPMVWVQKSNRLNFNIALAAEFNVDNK